MSVIVSHIKSGQYHDSARLMQLQKSLAKMDNVLDVGVLMGTGSNKSVLELSGLYTQEIAHASTDDLIIVIKAKDNVSAEAALSQIDSLLLASKTTDTTNYHPKSLERALKIAKESNWVCVSINGRYAVNIVEESLDANKNVFLFSDNVSIEDERRLKKKALDKGLMVLGPDCGTAIINGIGFGFSNKVKKGHIGIVAASGTGLQAVSVAIDDLGEGISHAIGTGGRDLKESIGAITSLKAIHFLENDAETKVIILISKPPAKAVSTALLQKLQKIEKPCVVYFIGQMPPSRHIGNIHFALSLYDAASLAAQLTHSNRQQAISFYAAKETLKSSQKYLRGLFSGGTLAYEAIGALKDILPEIYSNISLDKNLKLKDVFKSEGHTILDLGEDEFTIGKLHPMMDSDLRIRCLLKEANDENVAVIILDIVLGFCAHPNTGFEFAAAIKKAKELALFSGRHLPIIALVVGTENDPQNRDQQIAYLQESGAIIVRSTEDLVYTVNEILAPQNVLLTNCKLNETAFTQPIHIINIGLEVFSNAFKQQGVPCVQVEWSPPANGNEYLISLLAELKDKEQYANAN